MRPRIRLHRLGSDPEFLFVSEADLGYSIVPASSILGENKEKTSLSFIGLDSRPILGELRPEPFRNIKRHLYELAFGLDSIETFLNKEHPSVKVLAYPSLHAESLGGHIHASFFMENPLLAKWAKQGFTIRADGCLVGAISPPGAMLDAYANELEDGNFFIPYTWVKYMNWLLLPFENGVQPWVARVQRNAHYGHEGSGDTVRLGTSKPPKYMTNPPSWLNDSIYVHWEYRLPSTWLHHPCIAYVYLALAKLTMLNLRHVMHAVQEYRAPLPKMENTKNYHNYRQIPPSRNAEYFATLRSRLDALYRDDPNLTKDLQPLHRAIDKCEEKRREWYYNTVPIDIQAWRKILA